MGETWDTSNTGAIEDKGATQDTQGTHGPQGLQRTHRTKGAQGKQEPQGPQGTRTRNIFSSKIILLHSL